MKNNFYIKQLFHARKLNSDKDYHIFENAVKNLYDKITIQDIYKICNIFCDNTNDHEFMFQLVHLIEQIKGKCYLYCIARCSPDMTEANEQAMILNKRIINSSENFYSYIQVIRELQEPYKTNILNLLIDIKHDDTEKFGDKIDFLIEKANKIF